MKSLFLVLGAMLTMHIGVSQQVVIGNTSDTTHLKMENGLLILSDNTEPIAGAIRYENGEFQGYDGSAWISLSGAPKKEILGYSNQSSNGRFVYGGKVGIEAANEMCKDSYPNEPTAHMYLPHEIDEALSNDLVNGVTDNQTFWVFYQGVTSTFPSNTDQNNCHCFTFNSGETARGTRAYITTQVVTPGNGGGVIGNRVNYQQNTSCGLSHKVLCGK